MGVGRRQVKGPYYEPPITPTRIVKQLSSTRGLGTSHRKRKVPALSACISPDAFPPPSKEQREEKLKNADKSFKNVERRARIAHQNRFEMLSDMDEEPRVVEKQATPVLAPKEASRAQSVAVERSYDPQPAPASRPPKLLNRPPVTKPQADRTSPAKLFKDKSTVDETVEQEAAPAEPTREERRSSVRKDAAKPLFTASRSGRTVRPAQLLVAEQQNTMQPQPPNPALAITQDKAKAKMVVPPGMVVVADLPDVPPKSPTRWVSANATFAKPEPIQEFVFMHGTKMPGNTFKELWTVEEQEQMIVEVQKWLKRDAKSNGDAPTWSGVSWKGVTWSSVKGPFNNYFKGVTQPMGTPLAKPYQLVGVVVLGHERLFVDRTWKDLKDRSVLIWEIIAPDYVKPKPKPLQKPGEPAPGMSSARPHNTSSSLTSIQSSDDDFPGNPPRPHIAVGPTKDQLAWRVDDHDQAPDHQNLKPKLPRPAYTERSEALQAKLVEGGPCYMCRAHESLEVWRQTLYMKVPVLKTTVSKRVKAKENDSYQNLKTEEYEVYCTECYQRDYKSRSMTGGPCSKCGRTESCEEWYENLFLQDPTGTVFCSHCYTADHNDRHQQLIRKHNDMHDLWKGQRVDYGDGKAKDTFWEGLHKSIPKDVATNSIFNPRYQVHPNRTSTDRAMGKTSKPGQAEGDTNATIDDDTIEESTTSFADRSQASMQGELQFSSGPDDESGSPRITRRRPAATASLQASIPPLRRPVPHPTEAAIPNHRGPAARQGRPISSKALYRPVADPSRDASAIPVRVHPLFREADARRQAASQSAAKIPALSSPAASQNIQVAIPPLAHPASSQSRQATIQPLRGHPLFREGDARRQAASQGTAIIPALTLPASNQSRQATIPPLARQAPSQSRQAAIPVLRGPSANQSGAVAIPALEGPMPIRDGGDVAEPEAIA